LAAETQVLGLKASSLNGLTDSQRGTAVGKAKSEIATITTAAFDELSFDALEELACLEDILDVDHEVSRQAIFASLGS
jgi:hypothetical protein